MLLESMAGSSYRYPLQCGQYQSLPLKQTVPESNTSYARLQCPYLFILAAGKRLAYVSERTIDTLLSYVEQGIQLMQNNAWAGTSTGCSLNLQIDRSRASQVRELCESSSQKIRKSCSYCL